MRQPGGAGGQPRLTPISMPMPMPIAIPVERLACQSTDYSNTHSVCVCAARVAALTFDFDMDVALAVARSVGVDGPVCLLYIIFLLMTCIFMSSEKGERGLGWRVGGWECKQADFNNKQT